uniref:Uncharacterized protein n=1 Tax=Arundo donax TaxID=35708 RepID=A0A0A9BS99_ARUDO
MLGLLVQCCAVVHSLLTEQWCRFLTFCILNPKRYITLTHCYH